MEVLNLNYWAILVAGIVYMVLGSLWYSLFAKKWMECCNVKEEDLKCCCKTTYLWAFLVALVTAFGLSVLIHKAHATNAMDGAHIGFWSWLAVSATGIMSSVIWERKPLTWWFITAGFTLLGLVVSGAILGYWQ